MPDKTPEFWINVYGLIPEPVRAAMLSFFIAMLRIFYDGTEPRWSRRLLEGMLCGSVTLGVTHLVEAIGFNQNWGIFGGAVIGLLGADWVRTKARSVAEDRIK